MCLAVSCHLHFWQNDRDFLCATAVIQRWSGYDKSLHRKFTWRKKYPAASVGNLIQDLSLTSVVL